MNLFLVFGQINLFIYQVALLSDLVSGSTMLKPFSKTVLTMYKLIQMHFSLS